jgi:hypothetical protein
MTSSNPDEEKIEFEQRVVMEKLVGDILDKKVVLKDVQTKSVPVLADDNDAARVARGTGQVRTVVISRQGWKMSLK